MAKVITTELQHSGASGANITLDSSKNVTCENNLQVDGNITVTGTLPADKLTGSLPAISGASLTGVTDTLSFRRLNINGAMNVAQRATSHTITGNGGSQNDYRVVDRYKQQTRSDANWTYSQESDGPTGFANCFKALCTQADSAIAANVYEQFEYHFEGQDVQQLAKGTAAAKQFTVSFWVKSNCAGTYILEAIDEDNSRICCKTYTVPGNTNWNQFTLTFPADTTGALGDDTGASLVLNWWTGAGSDKSSGTLQTTWGSKTEANRAVGQVQLGGTVNNYWQITGIQVEVGDTATDFEHRPYSYELARCQRYCHVLGEQAYSVFSQGTISGSTNFNGLLNLPQTMRSIPSISASGTTRVWDAASSTNTSSTGMQTNESTKSGVWLNHAASGASFTTGNSAMWSAYNDSSARVVLSAEL